MSKINRMKRKIYKGIAAFYAVLFFMSGFGFSAVSVYAAEPNADSPTSQEGNYSDYSFYNMASVIANTVNNCFSKGDKTVNDVFGSVNRGQAGAYLGFPDANLGNESTGYFYTNTSKSEVTVSYQQIADMKNSEIGKDIGYADLYAALGAVLAETGCDTTDLGSNLPMGRAALGGILYLLFNMSRIVNKLFIAMLKFLQFVNPFAFFKNLGGQTVDGVHIANDFDNINTGTSIFGSSLLTSFGNLYKAAQKLGLGIAVLFFAFILVFFFLNKTVFIAHANKPFNHGTMFKKWFIRLLFLFWGIPILGFAYTAALDSMINGLSGDGSNNMNAAKVVQSVLCDFYDFAVNPDGIGNSFTLSDSIIYKVDKEHNVRYGGGSVMTICYVINKSSHPDITDTPINGNEVSKAIESLQTANTDASGINEDFTSNIISMYMEGAQFSAGDYNNLWVSQNWKTKEDAKKATALIDTFSSVAVMMDENTTLGAEGGNEVAYGARFSILGNKNPLSDGLSGGADGDPGKYLEQGTYNIPQNFKLSPMAAFNYLNTKFGSNSLTITSSTRALASASRISHNKVNLVGHGVGAIINYLLCVVMIITELIIGIFYAFSLLFGNLKRGFRMLLAVPGAFLGSVASIARVITYTVMMIIEVVGTILLYSLACEVIYVLGIFLSNKVFEVLAADAVGASVLAYGLLSPVQMIASLFIIVMYIWLIFVLIRMRKPIIKAMDGVADSIINSFMMNVQNSSMTGQAVTKGLSNLSNPSAHKGLVGKAENKTNKSLAAVLGGGAQGGSAMSDEFLTDAELKGKREAAKAKRKALATGTVQTVAGVGAVAAGVMTSNPGLIAGGVKSAGKGVGNVAGSGKVADNVQQTHNDAALNAVKAENAGQAGAMDQTKNGLDQYSKDVQSDMNKASVNSLMDSGKDIAMGGIMGASGSSIGGTASAAPAMETVGATAGGMESVTAANGVEVVTEGSGMNVASQMGGSGSNALANIGKNGLKSMGNSHEVPMPEMTNSHMQQKENITVDKQANLQINQQNINVGGGGKTPTRLVGGKPTNVAQQIIDSTQQNILRSQKQTVTNFNNAVDQGRRNAMANIANGRQQSATVHDGMNLSMINDQNTSYSMGANNISGNAEGGLGGQLNQQLNRTMHTTENVDVIRDMNITEKTGQVSIDHRDGQTDMAKAAVAKMSKLTAGGEGGLGNGGVNAAAKRSLKQ